MDPQSEMHKQGDDRDRYRQQVCLASLNTANLASLLTQYLMQYRQLLVSVSHSRRHCHVSAVVSRLGSGVTSRWKYEVELV